MQETQPEDVAPPPAPPSFPAPSTSTPSPSPATTEAGGQVRNLYFRSFFSLKKWGGALLLLKKFLISFSRQVCSPAMFHPTSSQEGFQQVNTENKKSESRSSNIPQPGAHANVCSSNHDGVSSRPSPTSFSSGKYKLLLAQNHPYFTHYSSL